MWVLVYDVAQGRLNGMVLTTVFILLFYSAKSKEGRGKTEEEGGRKLMAG